MKYTRISNKCFYLPEFSSRNAVHVSRHVRSFVFESSMGLAERDRRYLTRNISLKTKQKSMNIYKKNKYGLFVSIYDRQQKRSFYGHIEGDIY